MPLDPEAAAWLERQRGQPPRSSLSIAETRAAYMRSSAEAAERVPVARAEDLLITRSLPARLYCPSLDSALPVLVWFHGGRFVSGNLETHDGLARALALASGWRVIVVDYRLAPEHPFHAAVDDAVSAVEWAFSLSDRVAVGGDSAGANLAAVVALGQAGQAAERLRCQILVYPMLDPECAFASHREFGAGYGPGSEDMQRGWREYLSGSTDAIDVRVSPLFAKDLSGSPPAFVLTAEYDCLRDEGEEYARRLQQAGAEVLLRRYEGAIHGFFQMPEVMRLAREAIGDAGEYLRKYA